MVFSMNVFKNKKRWQNKKKTLKNVKNVPWIKNVFYIYAEERPKLSNPRDLDRLS